MKEETEKETIMRNAREKGKNVVSHLLFGQRPSSSRAGLIVLQG